MLRSPITLCRPPFLPAVLRLPPAASAHPHVFVTSKSEIVYAPSRALSPVSGRAGPSTTCSRPSRRRASTRTRTASCRARSWQPLAQTNVESLKEFDYFTFAKLGGKKLLLKPPVDYWLDFTDNLLTLHFFLPLMAPQTQGDKPLVVEIYDPTYFVAFELAEKDPPS